VSKRFGGVIAVNDISMEIDEGDLVGIIGPNGAGKTTLFNLITSFERPDKGSILFRDRNIVGLKPNQIAKLGLVRTFQLVRPFKTMSVMQNLRVGYNNRKLHEEGEFNNAAKTLLKSLRFEGREEEVAGNLSHGEMKRLEIARALIMAPAFVLLDEPFAGLSAEEISGISDSVRYYREQGLTFAVIEHDLQALMALVQRVIVLDHGSIIASGTPTEVAANEQVIDAYLGTEAKKVT
jgi:branched-chain amino acid transport system ATP-binding protein